MLMRREALLSIRVEAVSEEATPAAAESSVCKDRAAHTCVRV